ncbi:MAG: hypothetical protein ACOZE5_03775 [Verrucomicrobiota bacterium]
MDDVRSSSVAGSAIRRGIVWHLLSLICIAGVLAFYLWTLHSARGALIPQQEHRDYYNLLVDGFQAGHLHMKVEVDPALLVLPPKERPGNAPYLLDASLYNDRYYLYFGVVPAVLLHWPFAGLTGRDLPDALAVLILASAALGVGLLWWRDLRRLLWPGLGPQSDWLVVLALGLGSGVPAVLRRPLFYEEAALSGWLFGALMLWALVRAYGSKGRGASWLVLAGLACGLAVGSRANLVLAGLAALSTGAGLAGRRFSPEFRRGMLPALGLAAVGVLPVGLALGGYNCARFGRIHEFGHSYQLGHNPEQMFRLTNLAHNVGLYYTRTPELNAYFPYVLPPEEEAKPADYIGRESVHGEWPWLMAGLLAVPAALLAGRQGAIYVLPVLVWFAGNLLVTGLLGVRANRYMLDFHPALVCAVMAGVGWAAAKARGRWRFWRASLTALVLLAVIFNVFASFQVHGFFAGTDPQGYQRLGRFLDRIVWHAAPWIFHKVGDRETGLRWPPQGEGGVRPLLSVGVPEFQDRLWLRLDGQGRASFEVQHRDYGSVLGPEFEYQPGAVSKLRLSGAFLLPPVWHEWYGALSPEGRTAIKRRLRIRVDDAIVFDRDVPSFATAPWWQKWGPLREGSARVSLPDAGWVGKLHDSRGAVRMRLRLPGDRFASSEPLLQSGSVSAWDVVMVQFTRPGHVRVLHDSSGQGAVASEEFAVDYGATHVVEIESPVAQDGLAWNRHDTLETRMAEWLTVRWNGRIILRSTLPVHPADVASVAVGLNEFASACRSSYAAELQRALMLEPLKAEARAWGTVLEPGQAFVGVEGVLMHWRRDDRRQAAVVWRRLPGTDAVQLGWIDDGQVMWSEAPLSERSGAFQFERVPAGHSVPPVAAEPGMELIRVLWEERVLISGYTDFYAGRTVSAHALGGAGWTVTPLSERKAGVVQPQAERHPGRVEMHLALPEGGLRESVPLLTAGRPGRGDAIFLRPVGPDAYVFGLDHWGVAAFESRPVGITPAKRMALGVEMGSLFPAGEFPPDLVRVWLDGKVVLELRTPLHPVQAGEVEIGLNRIGFSTCRERFPGEIYSVRRRVPAAP